MYIQRKRRIVADDEIDVADIDVEEMPADEGGADIAPEATDLLFETEDVAELVAEITGEPVEVTADEDVVTFAVGDTEYTVEAEGDEEVLESVRKPFKGKKTVRASRSAKMPAKRPAARGKIKASTSTARRTVARRRVR